MITSPDNDRVRFVRSLYAKKNRYEERAFIIEGVRLVEEALRAGTRPLLTLYQPEVLERTARGDLLLDKLGTGSMAVSERVLKSVSDTVAPQGILAVVPFPGEPSQIEGTLVLVLDGLRDPGNLGTILRTAVAAGVKTVVSTADTVDPFSPKVVRAGMGAHFRLSLFVDKTWPQIERLAEDRTVFLAVAHEGRAYYSTDWRSPAVLIVSSEAHGASKEARQAAAELVEIPMAPEAESLNAAVAAGIILFEAYKQQTQPNTKKG